MVVANDVPAGQGHQFGQEPARAWAEVSASSGPISAMPCLACSETTGAALR